MSKNAKGNAATVLNVDADDASRFAVTQTLQKAGFRVREAATAADALTAAADGPDLIVLDLHLPDVRGTEVCRRLKADPASAPIPVLLFSRECKDSRCRIAGFEAGADACLARPVVADELVAQARTLLRLRRAEQQLRERAEEVEKLLDVLPVAVWIAHDSACRSMTGNRASYELLGLPPHSNVSVTAPENERPALRHFRDGQEIPPDELPMQQAAAHGVEVRDAEFDFVLPGGATKHVYGSATPLLDSSGEVRGCVGVFMDLTERRRVEQALRASEERFRLLAKAASDGFWDLDLTTGWVWWNDAYDRLYGPRPADMGHTMDWWLDRLHPDDRERVLRSLREAIAGEGERWAEEYRFRREDGSYAYVLDRGFISRDAKGQAIRFAGAMLDLTDRKRAEAELREADRRKDEFLATLAHELRNPLAPVRNAAQILKARGPADPNLEWARTVIDRQVELMARLLDDLLDVSRISRGKLQLRRERVELAAVVRSALETSRPHIAEMDHQLTVTLPGQPVVLEADLSRLAQVFLNLLTNAAKYTDRGGRITLTAEQQGRDVVVTVKDSGIGIPADQLPHIFEMFTQVNHPSDRSRGGLGIGLSLVKRLVEMHGGRIEARSDGPDCGSEFVVRLPVAVETPGPAASGAAERPAAGASLRILVVDDNRDGADTLAMMLRINGNDTRTAYDGEEALAAAEAFRPDVVLLDIGLPKLNGYEVCRRIREQSWGGSMVLIAQTGWGQEEDRRRSREAGFDHHIVKPVDPHELLSLLAGVKTT